MGTARTFHRSDVPASVRAQYRPSASGPSKDRQVPDASARQNSYRHRPRSLPVEQVDGSKRTAIRFGSAASTDTDGVNPIELAELLDELERLNPRHARLVELRFYAGLTMPQAAEIMNVSLPTAERDWRAAKAWLRSQLTDGSA